MTFAAIGWRRYALSGLAIGIFAFTVACGPGAGIQPAATASIPMGARDPASEQQVELEAKYANVIYRPPSSDEQPVPEGQRLGVLKDGAVSVNNRGEGWLYFPEALIVRVYERSQVMLEGQVDRSNPAGQRIRLESGGMFGDNMQRAVSKHVTIDVGWAVIRDTGTQFFVYYDPAKQFIWAVVVNGSIEISAAGATVRVPAGWQTWAELQQAPKPPIPATRVAIGGLAPLVDDMSGQRLHDVDVLTNQQCRSGDTLKLRATPDSRSDENKVGTMPPDTHFEALARTGDTAWIYGIEPTGKRGWAAAKYLICAYDPAMLTTDVQQLPPELARPSPPALRPTATATAIATAIATATSTPLPTPTLIPADTTPPSFQSELLYDPKQLYVLDCGLSNTVAFSVKVTDPDDTPTVEFIYHYQLKGISGPEHRVIMSGQQPDFATNVDIGQEVFKDLKGAADSIIYDLRATDKHGNTASLSGKPIDIATSQCPGPDISSPVP